MKNNTNISPTLWSRGKKLLRVIGFSTLAGLLAWCGDKPQPSPSSNQVRTVQSEAWKSLRNPFEGVDTWKYQKPWLEPKESPGVLYPVLIPGQKKWEKSAPQLTTTKIWETRELSNTWDPVKQTLTIYFPFSNRELWQNDGRDLQSLVRFYTQSGAKLRRIQIKWFADPVGGDINNDLVSRQRVERIRKELARLGINENEVTIEFEAVGRREAKWPEGKKDARERKVEITITDAITESVAQLDPKPDVIFVDNSDSMQSNLEVLNGYFRRGWNADTAFYVFPLENTSWDLLSHNAQLLKTVGGSTPLFSALNDLVPYAASQREKLGRKPVIAVVTDGERTSWSYYLHVNTESAIIHLVKVPGYSSCPPLEKAVNETGGQIRSVE